MRRAPQNTINSSIRHDSDRGSMSLFIAVIVLPLIFFLFSLSVDLETYYRETQRAQKAADSAALYASRFLPFTAQATQAARSYLSSFGSVVSDAQIQVSSDFLSISINSTIEPNFPQLLGIHLKIPLTAYSKARTTPLDVFLAMDTASYLAPALTAGPAWGDSSWPSAQFFTTLAPELNGSLVDSQLATQQCFNPAFSALKQAAITSYDYLAGFRLNEVGLGFFPGSVNELDVVREILPGGQRPSNFSTNAGEADFVPYTTLVNSDAYCAAASEQETATDRYRLPSFSVSLGGEWPHPFDRPASMITPGTWTFDSAYQPSLRAREVIWSRVVKPTYTSAVMPQSDLVIQSIVSRLMAPPAAVKRGGLNQSSFKKGIILAGDVPWVNGNRFASASDGLTTPQLTSVLSAIRAQIQSAAINLKLYYLILRSDYSLEGVGARAQELQSFFDQFALSTGNSSGSFVAKVMLAESPEELSNRLVGEMMLDSKTVMISR